MKLQDAYVSEANAVGRWGVIGYKMADSPNFAYDSTQVTYGTNGTTALVGSDDIGVAWAAKNRVAMNDCGATTCEWTLKLTGDDKGNGVKYEAGLADAARMLTPSFEQIGK